MTHSIAVLRNATWGIFATLCACSTSDENISAAPQLGLAPLDKVIDALTLEEKIQLIRGTGMDTPSDSDGPAVGATKDRVPGAAGSTSAVPRLGIPSIVLADGPAGVRISPTRDETPEQSFYATAFPIASQLASSWDVELVEQVGRAIGHEAKEYGVDVLLAPALNIHRYPLGGRNFEYYSEDPLLSGKIAAAMVNGVQSQGVGTSLKHFVANNHEWNRNTIDVVVDERAYREVYLRGFEIAVRESAPWTIMSSYNKVNGEYTSESDALLTTILREQWGFDGLVMTDWFGGEDPIKQMHAGNDLLMPGADHQNRILMNAVKNGELPEDVLDRNVANILNVVSRSSTFKNYEYSDRPDLEANAAIARSVAEEGMVLLKNKQSVLPLVGGAKIALFGNFSYDMAIGGTGSGDVNEAYIISLERGLANAGFDIDAELATQYRTYISEEKAKRPVSDHWLAEYMPKKPFDELVFATKKLNTLAQGHDYALVTIGRSSGEFVDREEQDFYLTDAEKEMLASVSASFRAEGKPVIVILNIGGVIEMANWVNTADAILLAYQPGQEAGNAVADILAGKVNPSGKLVDTLPIALQDYPAAKGFPGRATDPNAKPEGMMQTVPAEVVYDDSIWVGYRHFNTRNQPVVYPFGFGLSYTDFSYDNMQVSEAVFTSELEISLSVKNTGAVAGKEVTQLYVSAPNGKLEKPTEELRAFAKTALLQAGESEQLTFRLAARDLASYDSDRGAWVVAPGEYMAKAGASSRDFRKQISFRVENEIVIAP